MQVVKDDTGVEGEEVVRRGEQRIDIDLLEDRLLHHKLAEAHDQTLQHGEVHRRATADALQRGEDPRPLHQATGKRRRERRQAERAILIDLDQLAARPEEKHRTELRVGAGAEDELVAV
jgi:hypothetical protein